MWPSNKHMLDVQKAKPINFVHIYISSIYKEESPKPQNSHYSNMLKCELQVPTSPNVTLLDRVLKKLTFRTIFRANQIHCDRYPYIKGDSESDTHLGRTQSEQTEKPEHSSFTVLRENKACQ